MWCSNTSQGLLPKVFLQYTEFSARDCCSRSLLSLSSLSLLFGGRGRVYKKGQVSWLKFWWCWKYNFGPLTPTSHSQRWGHPTGSWAPLQLFPRSRLLAKFAFQNTNAQKGIFPSSGQLPPSSRRLYSSLGNGMTLVNWKLLKELRTLLQWICSSRGCFQPEPPNPTPTSREQLGKLSTGDWGDTLANTAVSLWCWLCPNWTHVYRDLKPWAATDKSEVCRLLPVKTPRVSPHSQARIISQKKEKDRLFDNWKTHVLIPVSFWGLGRTPSILNEDLSKESTWDFLLGAKRSKGIFKLVPFFLLASSPTALLCVGSWNGSRKLTETQREAETDCCKSQCHKERASGNMAQPQY